MRKTLLISFAVLFSVGFISCDKSKNCSCTEVVKTTLPTEWDDDDFTFGMDGTATYPKTIEKGECSDLNVKSEVNNTGMKVTTTVTCVEQ